MSPLCLASSTLYSVFKVHQRHAMCQYFVPFLWLSGSPLGCYTMSYLSIHQVMDICMVSTFWVL